MSGKGSSRRPQQAPDEQVSDNWSRIFGHGVKDDPTCKECNKLKPTTKAECDQCIKDTPAFTELVNRMCKKEKSDVPDTGRTQDADRL